MINNEVVADEKMKTNRNMSSTAVIGNEPCLLYTHKLGFDGKHTLYT